MTTEISVTPSTSAGFGLLLHPANIEAAKDLAKTLANSGLVPQAFAGKPDAILIAGAMGARLGLDIFSALAGIAVVNGRPTLWGDAQLAVCQSRQDWGGMAVEWSGNGDDTTCTVTISRKGVPPVAASFSIRDAMQAGLWGKQGPWKQFPRRMVELRARAFALRAAYADALAGFAQREEVEDFQDVTASATVRIPEPTAARVRDIPTGPELADKHLAPAAVEPVAPATDAGTAQAPVAGDEPVVVTGLDTITVEQIQATITKLWKLKPGGIDAGKALLAKWKLTAISEMGGASQELRADFVKDIASTYDRLVAGGAK